jgi:UDP-N-acetylmuramate dehydrogenase
LFLTNTAEFRDLTTLRVGGSISDFREPKTRAELIETFHEVSSAHEPWFLLGGGSNIVVSDEPFDGTVIRVVTQGIDRHTDGDRVLVTAQAGESWDALVEWTVDNGLAGLEALSAIPGTVGGAPIQNIGAYGAELADTFESLQLVPPGRGDVVTLRPDALNFGYRHSSLKHGLDGLVVSVTFALTPSETSTPIKFEQLANALGVPLGATVALADIRRAVLELRASKGMVISDDPDSVSVGSFFTNPVVADELSRQLPADAPRFPLRAERSPLVFPLGVEPEFVDFDTEPTEVKLSAAWLIERAGIGKGFSLAGSDAAVSTKHTLAIINRGNATADQVLELARYVTIRVHDTFGVMLEPEPTMIGFD